MTTLVADDAEDPTTPDTLFQEDLYVSPARLARLQGDFARLIPDNYEAKRAFSGVVAVMKATPNPERFWECLTHFNDEQEFLASELETSADEEEANKELQQIWTGHFRFNLNPELLPPEWSKYGWIMGKEREDIKAANVAIKLTSDPKERGVRGRHARLALNQDSNALMLYVDDNRVVRLNGEPIKGQSRVIDGQQTRIQLGQLQYCLEYTNLSPVRYQQQLDNLRDLGILRGLPHKSLEATPTEQLLKLENWIIHPPFARGTFGVICACVRRRDGAPFAAKRVFRTKRSEIEIQTEIDMLKAMGEHPNTCRFVEVIEIRSTMSYDAYGDTYIIYGPLAEGTLEGLRLDDRGYCTSLDAFAQAVKGLQHIHHCGWMHRDIKPTNILYRSKPIFSVVIADYGHGTRETQSADHTKGTIRYLAPEILTLKKLEDFEEETAKQTASRSGDQTQKVDQQLYGRKAEVFSLGVTMFELFYRAPGASENRSLSAESTLKLRQKILEESSFSVAPLISKMLSREPESRPSMDELASWPGWPKSASVTEGPARLKHPRDSDGTRVRNEI